MTTLPLTGAVLTAYNNLPAIPPNDPLGTLINQLVTALAAQSTDVQTFAAGAHVWTKPAGAKRVEVFLIGGAGGGGSGRKGLTATARGGGGGGSGGRCAGLWFDATALGATENLVVGAGGVGGAAVFAASTDGNDGGAGTASSFGTVPYLRSPGGNGVLRRTAAVVAPGDTST